MERIGPFSEIHKCYDPTTIRHVAPLKLCFKQTNFNAIFVNLKPTTECQEAMNITCSHKDN